MEADGFADIDLDQMETGWGQSTRPPTPPADDAPVTDQDGSRAKPRKKDKTGRFAKARPGEPRWTPYQPGVPLDRKSPRYLADLENFKRGIPRHEALTWMQVQLWDNGEDAKTRYKVRLEFTDQPAEVCTRAGKRAVMKVRHAPFSSRKQFIRNLKRKKKPKVMEFEWAFLNLLFAEMDRVDEQSAEQGLPPAMFGMVQTVFDGTRTYEGQYCVLIWSRGADGAEVPIIAITQHQFGAIPGVEVLGVALKPAKKTPGRSSKASDFVGSWFSDALQARIDTGKAIKDMRQQDIDRRTATVATLAGGGDSHD
jgi:hypothetical protein